MRREMRLTGSKSFSLVFEQGVSFTHPLLVLKMLPTGMDRSRIAFLAGKRLGNAVVRNKVRRRLRETLRFTGIKSGWDIVIIARRRAINSEYRILKQAVENLLIKASLLEKDSSVRRDVS